MSQEQQAQQGQSQERKAAVIVMKDGKPYGTKQSASMALANLGLDPSTFRVAPHPSGDGWCITDAQERQGEKDTGAEKPAKAAETVPPDWAQYSTENPPPGVDPKDLFCRVKFQPKQNEFDPQDVFLSVNGNPLIIERGKMVVIPYPYAVAADHAVFDKFKVEPGQERKVVAHIKKYPYDWLGWATRAEYQRMLREGNEAQRKALDQAMR